MWHRMMLALILDLGVSALVWHRAELSGEAAPHQACWQCGVNGSHCTHPWLASWSWLLDIPSSWLLGDSLTPYHGSPQAVPLFSKSKLLGPMFLLSESAVGWLCHP